MNASGNNFTQSFPAPVGATLTFYFTYRVGTSGIERNSSANPHTVIAGNCINNVAPAVTLTSPLNGQTFTAGVTLTLSANALDSDGSVAKVEFYKGNTLLYTDFTAPYTYAWTGVAAGTYAITAKATDNANATTVSSVVSITVNTVNSAVCTGNGINGDYSYEVRSSNGTATIVFLPKAPIAGSTMAILYVGINNGPVSGMYMNATGSNFTKSFSVPVGAAITFYFTYRVGTSAIERNSSATPHTVALANCISSALKAEEVSVAELNSLFNASVYPNPVQDKLMIQLPSAGLTTTIIMMDMYNNILLKQDVSESGNIELNVSQFANGLYVVRLQNETTEVVKTVIIAK